ncbi:MAG TPA: 4-oxalocrotonate tautomerase [Burkholderiaceae bacterium]|nr:4-oxalocrotonate tautomerase [Burkholderiaceae bacterium]
MPFIHVRYTRPTPHASLEGDPAALAALATDLTSRLLGKRAEVTAVLAEPVDAARWFVAGDPVAGGTRATFHWVVSVTRGTNTKDEKAAYIREVYARVAELLGPVHEASYVLVHEVDGDGYGYAGLTQERRYIDATPR